MSAATVSPSKATREEKLAQKDWKNRQRNRRRAEKQAQQVKLTGKQRVMSWLLHIVMAVMVIYCLVPLLWLVFSSTKSNSGLYTSPGLWFADKNVFFQNVHDTFTFKDGVYPRWLLES